MVQQDKFLIALVIGAILISAFGTFLTLQRLGQLSGTSGVLTGFAVSGTGSASITQSGTAGITMRNQTIAFGSGYFNYTSCTGSSDFAELWSLNGTLNYTSSTVSQVNTNATCWVNTTTFLDPSIGSAPSLAYHTVENSGSTTINLTAYITYSNTTAAGEAEDIFCVGGCNDTTSAAVGLFAYSNESGACASALNFTALTYGGGLANQTLCSNLDFTDTSDAMNVFVMMRVPKDVTSGAKSFTVNYQAAAN